VVISNVESVQRREKVMSTILGYWAGGGGRCESFEQERDTPKFSNFTTMLEMQQWPPRSPDLTPMNIFF
jgi:hypothetical protein